MDGGDGGTGSNVEAVRGDVDCGQVVPTMTMMQRVKATLALYPYMVPLFVVYFAEVCVYLGQQQAAVLHRCARVTAARRVHLVLLAPYPLLCRWYCTTVTWACSS